MKLSNKTSHRLKAKYGDWVLITGATSGIGKELALKFGEAGFNLVLTGRRKQLLASICAGIATQNKVETLAVAGDLSNADDLEQLIQATAEINIRMVILNAGFGTSGKFIDSDLAQELNLLDVNCRAILQLTHFFSNRLKAQKRQGAIVLLSSMVAFQGVPNAANYAASKAYVQSLGEALSIELKPEGIDVLTIAPGPVESGFSGRANMQMGKAMKPEAIALATINAIGRQSTLLPGFLTKLLVYNLRMTPRWLKVIIMGKVMSGFTAHQS
jgi:uncharacterized protein